jgi:hypothetical protein
MADSRGLTVAPMNEKVILNPGESVQSSFKISNPVDSTSVTNYELAVEPFYMKDGGEVVSGEDEVEKEYTLMKDWIKFDVPTKGKLEPNEVIEVLFTINVPNSAPAGGQYAMISVTSARDDSKNTSDNKTSGKDSETTITELTSIGHLIYAEVTGNTIKKGEISDVNVSSFLLDGNIKGSATVKNTGNVHGTAKYSLQVFPLFSNEEVFTNEEDPSSRTILPNRDYYAEVTWEDTPMMGIYNVVFRVEFEGETQEIKKMVIKMPVWMIFLIVFVIALLIIWITMKVRNKGKREAKSSTNKD